MAMIRAYLRMPPAERRIAASAMWLLAKVALGLRHRGWSRTYEALGTEICPCGPLACSPIRLVALVHRTADLLPFHCSCLVRSAVAWRMLRDHGIDASIRWAVGREGETLKGHAWVCLPGNLRPTDEWTGEDVAILFDSDQANP